MLRTRKTSRPMPSPIGSVTPGARNFSGASRNEIAKTMPSQMNVTAVASANHELMAGSSSSRATSGFESVSRGGISGHGRVEEVQAREALEYP